MEERTKKPLEEMSLIDDFLMTEIVGNEEYGGEFIDCFLETVLGHKIEVHDVHVQKVMTAGDTENRGIRLDIRTKVSLDQAIPATGQAEPEGICGGEYKASVNIEMQASESNTKPYQKYDIRRRSRLNQGMIDVNMLKTGGEYGELDDVLVIVCTSFDLFNRNRCIYTFANMCFEDRSLLLEDGAYRIFLNTSSKDRRLG